MIQENVFTFSIITIKFCFLKTYVFKSRLTKPLHRKVKQLTVRLLILLYYSDNYETFLPRLYTVGAILLEHYLENILTFSAAKAILTVPLCLFSLKMRLITIMLFHKMIFYFLMIPIVSPT